MLFLVKAKVREFGKTPMEILYIVSANGTEEALEKVQKTIRNGNRFLDVYYVQIVKPIANTETPVMIMESDSPWLGE